jgi:hypothetical protein
LNLYHSRKALGQTQSLRAQLYRSVHQAALRIPQCLPSDPLEHELAVTQPERTATSRYHYALEKRHTLLGECSGIPNRCTTNANLTD